MTKDFLGNKTEVKFYIFQVVFVFSKVNILLFSSLVNIITTSVGWWVGGRLVVGRSVAGGFNKTPNSTIQEC